MTNYTLTTPTNLKPPMLSFHFPNGGGEAGRLDAKDGVLTFTGNADAAAQIFIDHVIEKYDATLIDLRKQIASLTAASQSARQS